MLLSHVMFMIQSAAECRTTAVWKSENQGKSCFSTNGLLPVCSLKKTCTVKPAFGLKTRSIMTNKKRKEKTLHFSLRTYPTKEIAWWSCLALSLFCSVCAWTDFHQRSNHKYCITPGNSNWNKRISLWSKTCHEARQKPAQCELFF